MASQGDDPVGRKLVDALLNGRTDEARGLIKAVWQQTQPDEDKFLGVLNWKDKYGYTALIIASMKGYVAIAELLLQAGAAVNATDKDSETALHFAAFEGQLPVVKLLVRHGADVTAKNNDGRTPLDEANNNNKPHVVAFLQDADAMARERQAGKRYASEEKGTTSARTARITSTPQLLISPSSMSAPPAMGASNINSTSESTGGVDEKQLQADHR